MQSAVEIVRKKRDGHELTAREIEWLVDAYVRGEAKDYQMAAWLMAVFFRGLTPGERGALTRAMWRSGTTFPRQHRDDYWIDKHSTGGVGDKPSLILVPLVTSVCQTRFGAGRVRLPMVSGRGLGHSGGTLDKLEAVPGFSPRLTIARALELLEVNDFFMMGQTEDLAPADRLLYALRDVTATVESLPLIVASILSKKLSENLDGLVFDVKYGSGAFMDSEAKARDLAKALLSGARDQGVTAVALLTRMDEPLGLKVGNHLEIEECDDFLQGKPADAGLRDVTLALAGWMVALASRGELTYAKARELCESELASSRPRAIFRRMFEAQGGEWAKYLENRSKLDTECKAFVLHSPENGYVESIEPKAIGLLLNALGGGRLTKESTVDPLVGFHFLKKAGDAVTRGEPVVRVLHRRESESQGIAEVLSRAITFSAAKPAPKPWVLETLEPGASA